MMTVLDGEFSELGLEHVLEDGLALAENVELPPDRRRDVLEGVFRIFDSAGEGSELAAQNSLFVRADQKPALESFQMVYGYLHCIYEDRLFEKIRETRKVFSLMSAGEAIDEDDLSRSVELMKAFLEAVRLKRSLVEPVAPSDNS